jgi:SAM-dependent methyltransferase
VLLPLAEAGLEVVGVDASPHMLALARARLDEARLTAELIQQDMRALHLARRDFDLAILAVKSFVYLTERADQQRCLDAIHAHLRPGGLLAIDLLHPYPEWVTEPIGILRQDLTETDSNSGITVSRVEAVVSCDLSRQVRVIRSTYELVDSHGTVVEKRFVEWPYRWTYRFEAELLLEKAGFTVEAVYGGYRREPFTSESRAMVFLARKPSP